MSSPAAYDQRKEENRVGTAHETVVIYTVVEAAAILRVKESWLERQAAARKIPFTMLGGAYRFTSGHLAAIVRMHERAPCADSDETDREVRSRRPRTREHGTPQTATLLRPRPRTGPARGLTGRV